MNATRLIRVWGLLVMAVVLVLAAASEAQAQWPQWGGPNRNFAVATTGLADEWPEGGPRKLWHRELGAGYSFSAPTLVARTLYVRDRKHVMALDLG